MIHLMPCRNPCGLYIHLAYTYSVGPSSVVWSELGLALPFHQWECLKCNGHGLRVSCVKWPSVNVTSTLAVLVHTVMFVGCMQFRMLIFWNIHSKLQWQFSTGCILKELMYQGMKFTQTLRFSTMYHNVHVLYLDTCSLHLKLWSSKGY